MQYKTPEEIDKYYDIRMQEIVDRITRVHNIYQKLDEAEKFLKKHKKIKKKVKFLRDVNSIGRVAGF